MKIAGIEKLSLVDYPGKISTIVFTQGCNFKCGYCQNPDLIGEKGQYSAQEQDVLDFLKKRTSMIEGVVITGGEPTLQKDLPEFIQKIKDLGYSVKLDTNGTDPDMLEKLLKEYLVDYLAIDVKTSMENYPVIAGAKDKVEKVRSSIYLTMTSTIPYEMRTTCVPGIVDEEDIKKMAELCRGAKSFYLQHFRPTTTLDASFGRTIPYPKHTLERFKEILSEHIEKVEIRGL
jgi:pyruvate formate lyase activating enzyme